MANNNINAGYLELFLGPMFSGKTSRLIDIYKREEFCSQNPIVINYIGDNRYSEYETHMSSHDSIKIPCIRSNNLSDIFDISLYLIMKSAKKDNSSFIDNVISSSHDSDIILSNKINIIKSLIDETHPNFTRTILINEGQFFDDLYEATNYLVNMENKKVYVCGLDGDFQRREFGSILKIIPLCDEVVKLKAICKFCKINDGIFTCRLSNEKEQTVIGTDIYTALCRNCYNLRKNPEENV